MIFLGSSFISSSSLQVEFLDKIKDAYKNDDLYKKILANPEEYKY